MTKSQNKTFDAVRSYLAKNSPASAADIQKATKVKGNIYSKLQTMVERKRIRKIGKMYFNEPRMPLFSESSDSPDGEKVSNTVRETPPPNPYLNSLKREHEHIMQGIQQLQITANYLNLRIKEMERAASQ